MKEKLKTKDLIYAGAFGALYLILVMMIVMGSGIIPVLYLISPFTVGLICATVYMLYVTKVQKPGAILILSALFGLLTSTNSIFSLVWALLMGIIAELIVRAGKYNSKKMYTLSFYAFNLNMIGPFLMLVYAKNQFVSICAEYYGSEYAAALDALTPGWIIFALAALALLGAAAGTLLASRFMKKHFVKAGIA
ncbi:MptD family putative ECF transporter S component [Eubacterium sp. 1001713B170207_170306_E7]|uniref:MptD family putative ECF transporter S component n=1 Tax=Eubacterium sp. 1001713B170207_170306_E7 TaxID=2787097 RepID=UPI0018998B3B|nr:MptD family putative ECF transporter S component [Eubacterium sp. 1001713B170207_170306_E7]